jgi:thiamine-phosphate pyrophosphorylase
VLELSSRRLYLCCPLRPEVGDFLRAVIDGGVDVVQLRATSGTDREVLESASVFQSVCADRHVPFILNDRPDLAWEAGADGVHVGQDDVSVRTCREILGPDAVVGLSTHSEEQLDDALVEDVTYLSAGPIVPTPTKPGRSGTGIPYAQLAQSRSTKPVFVTGGVTPDAVPALVAAGLRHFVVVRYLTHSADPFRAAQQLAAALAASLDAP